MRQNAGMITRL